MFLITQCEANISIDLSGNKAPVDVILFHLLQLPCKWTVFFELKGGIGPSLVDDQWIHGGTPQEIYQTITNGVGAKGMPAWGPILGPEKVGELTAYVVEQNAEALGRPFPPAAGDREHEEGEDHGEREGPGEGHS